MRCIIIGLLCAGFLLLAAVVQHTDIAEVAARVRQVGWSGVAALFAVYFVGFSFDTLAWLVTLPSARLSLGWAYRIWKVRMVGKAFANVTPLAILGGEPVKAVLLNRHYGIDYQEGTASLVIAQTVNVISLTAFLLIGLVLMLVAVPLPAPVKWSACLGFATLSVCIVLFFVVQRFRMLSRVIARLTERRLGEKARRIVGWLVNVEDRLVRFYTRDRARFNSALAIDFLNWLAETVEVYLGLMFLGYPVTILEAWVIQAVVALVRSALFVVPAGIGSQEGAFVLICTAITGAPSAGLALAVIRRFREIVWILWGLYQPAMITTHMPIDGVRWR